MFEPPGVRPSRPRNLPKSGRKRRQRGGNGRRRGLGRGRQSDAGQRRGDARLNGTTAKARYVAGQRGGGEGYDG
jgi:hypothetical protein